MENIMKNLNFLNHALGDAAPFPIDPVLTGITVAYSNRAFIADEVLPRVPVSRMAFKYFLYPLNDGFQNLRTEVARKGKPKEIELSATEATSECVNQALDDAIPYDDIEDAPDNYDPEGRSVENLTNLILLQRELRAVSVVFNTANYATGYTGAITEEWDDQTNGVPVDDILTAKDVPIMTPNVMVIGQEGWKHLRTHPQIIKAINGTAGDEGAATRQQVMDLFELEKLLVGRSLYNTAKKGQTVSLSPGWSNEYCALLYIDPLADTRGGITFGFTAQKGTREAGSDDDKNIGAKGGKRVRVVEAVKELAVANRAGYLFSNVTT